MERIFASGMREFFKLREKRVVDPGALLDGARRAMRASFQRELDTIESNLSFLASVGSVSPYVGLFGTVWGIMHAFIGLSNLQQVTLASVAPGIAEALVATAIGLFAAIPAVIAYNRFARRDRPHRHPARELHRGVLEHPAAQCGRHARSTPSLTTCRRPSIAAPAPAHDQRDQHGPVHRRHAGAPDHLHGDRAAHHHRHRRPAERRQVPGAAGHFVEVVVGADEQLRLRVDGKDTGRSASPTSPPESRRAGRQRQHAGGDLGRPQRQVRVRGQGDGRAAARRRAAGRPLGQAGGALP